MLNDYDGLHFVCKDEIKFSLNINVALIWTSDYWGEFFISQEVQKVLLKHTSKGTF